MSGTKTHPGLFQRLKTALLPAAIHPAQMQSYHMPDLERWNMPHRSVDMRDWELALNMAKNLLRPDRTRLADLYESLLKDAHLGSVMETRVLRVVRGKYKLVDADGKTRPELLPLLETQWFEDFLQYVAEATFYGHTLIELGELARPGELRQVNRIDPRNVLPYHGIVARRMGEETGYAFREEPLRSYLIEVGRPDDLGILERVAPVAVVKKYAIGSWSAFVGTYGIPSRWVKTRGNDARRVKQLETVMQNMMSSAYAIIQGDEEFGISPTPTGDPVKVFDDLVRRCNSEMSKRILGQDGTTDNADASGTFGSLKVLAGVAEDRHAADKASAAYVVNQELLPRLTALGYPFGGVRFAWDELRDMAPGELVDAVAKLGMVFDIDPEHVEERTGIRILGARRMPGELRPDDPSRQEGQDAPPADPTIPVPEGQSIQDTAMNGAQVASLLELITKAANGEIPESVARPIIRTAFPKVPENRIDEMLNGMKDRQPPPPPTDTNPPGNGRQGGDKPKDTPPEGGEDEDEDEDGEDGVTAQWPRDTLGSCGICGGSIGPDITAEAGLTPLSDEEADQVLREIEESGGLFSQHYFSHTADALVPAFGQAWSKGGASAVDPNTIDTVAYTVMEANVYRFSGLKTRALALEINEIARTSKGFADFKQRVKESGKFGKFNRWRETEYANAMNSGMQASRYYSMKDRVDALPYWRYETMEDGRVREAHANLNNKVFRHDDPIWNVIYPPNGWRCRCYVTPTDNDKDVLDYDAHAAEDFLGRKGLDQMRRSGHDMNRARIGEVFKLEGAYRTENSKKVYVIKNGKKVLADPPIGYKEAYGEEAAQQSYAAIMSRPLPVAPPGASDATSARNRLFLNKKSIVVNDYIGRPFQFHTDTYDHHVKGKYLHEKRLRHLSAHLVPDVMSAPDEVWLEFDRRTGEATHRFIRYYQGSPVVVQTKATLSDDGKHSMVVHTWYEMPPPGSPDDTSATNRVGLLLKRNTR